MATTNGRLDPTAARAAAQKLYDERLAAVDRAVEATNTARALAEQLTEAERAAARAYADAERAGWTAEDLKRIGLDAPTRRLPGRPTRRSSNGQSDARTASEVPAPAETGPEAG